MKLTLLAILDLLVAAWLIFKFARALQTGTVNFGSLEFAKADNRYGYPAVSALYLTFAVMCLVVSADLLGSGS